MASDADLSVESLDHPVDNAPVRSIAHKGLTIEGYSRAAVQTYWRIPEMKLGFDLGVQPWSFMSTPNWFLSHTHLDHLAALPVYVARRRMMKMEPPTIYRSGPTRSRGSNMLLRAWQRLDRGRDAGEARRARGRAGRSSSRAANWSSRFFRPGIRSRRSGSWSGSVARSSSPSIATFPATTRSATCVMSGVEVSRRDPHPQGCVHGRHRARRAWMCSRTPTAPKCSSWR